MIQKSILFFLIFKQVKIIYMHVYNFTIYENVFLYKHINYMRTHRIFMNASSL